MVDMVGFMDRFFEEKQIEFQSWEIEDQNGITHIIDSDVVIEAIKGTVGAERKAIEITLRKIDFANGKVEPFLQHLAKGLINQGA